MLWYINDASLQGQFTDATEFLAVLEEIIKLRNGNTHFQQDLKTTRSLPQAHVTPHASFRQVIQSSPNRALMTKLLLWLDRTGPFVDDDRFYEADDYFEYNGLDITETGLGEATRRTKADTPCSTFSFKAGMVNFELSPLIVDHGLAEERLGQYRVKNSWEIADLIQYTEEAAPKARNWAELVAQARDKFPNLEIGQLDQQSALRRQPFDAILRDRFIALLDILNRYVEIHMESGPASEAAKQIEHNYFRGDNALFSAESNTNQIKFRDKMTFDRTTGEKYFAHWHGKVSHRTFRLHFEWPPSPGKKMLEVFYFGPKITKA